MICFSCNAQIPDESESCPQCGMRIRIVSPDFGQRNYVAPNEDAASGNGAVKTALIVSAAGAAAVAIILVLFLGILPVSVKADSSVFRHVWKSCDNSDESTLYFDLKNNEIRLNNNETDFTLSISEWSYDNNVMTMTLDYRDSDAIGADIAAVSFQCGLSPDGEYLLLYEQADGIEYSFDVNGYITCFAPTAFVKAD